MKSIKQIRLAFLAETIAHYNTHNRAFDEQRKKDGNGNGCLYTPIKGVSEGCAIGRHINDKALCAKFDNIGSVNQIFDKLPNKLQRLGRTFLSLTQTLHDDPTNWNHDGLTTKGKESAEKIKQYLQTSN